MKDQYERNIDYMRISVMDRCNLRCRYCMPEEGIECVRHEDVITYEEIIQIATAAAGLGISKIKITGGEPLVRKGIVSLVEKIKKIPGIKEVTLTTNGVLLKDMAEDLCRAGLDAVNISLDTLSPLSYFNITRRDKLEDVLLGIEKVYALGIRTKINCVPMREFNEEELPILAALSMKYNIDVRFIELMPVGLGKLYDYIPMNEVQGIMEEVYGPGEAGNRKLGNGPAIYLDYQGFQGSIGFISAMTHEFCTNCNRVRITSEGDLKLCLNHKKGLSLRRMLRDHCSGEELQKAMEDFIYHKPLRHCFHQSIGKDTELKNMVQIGG